MLATKLDATVNARQQVQSQVQPQDYERRRVSRQPAIRTRTRFDYISLFGSIVVCGIAGWVLASASAQAAGINSQIVQLQTQIQQVSAVNASYSSALDKLTQPAHILAVAAANGWKPVPTITIPFQGAPNAN